MGGAGGPTRIVSYTDANWDVILCKRGRARPPSAGTAQWNGLTWKEKLRRSFGKCKSLLISTRVEKLNDLESEDQVDKPPMGHIVNDNICKEF